MAETQINYKAQNNVLQPTYSEETFVEKYWLVKPFTLLLLVTSLLSTLGGCTTQQRFDEGTRLRHDLSEVENYDWQTKTVGPYLMVRAVANKEIPTERITRVRTFHEETEYSAHDYTRMAADALILPAMIRWIHCDDEGRIFGKASTDCQPYGTLIQNHEDETFYELTGDTEDQVEPLKHAEIQSTSNNTRRTYFSNEYGWIVLDQRSAPGLEVTFSLVSETQRDIPELTLTFDSENHIAANNRYEWSHQMLEILPELSAQMDDNLQRLLSQSHSFNLNKVYQQLYQARLKDYRKIPVHFEEQRQALLDNKPKDQELMQGEFESTAEFKQRVLSVSKQHTQAIDRWNQQVKNFDQSLKRFHAHHTNLPEAEVRLLRDVVINSVLGQPEITKVRFNPDQHAFIVTLRAAGNKAFQRTFSVPFTGTLSEAEAMKPLFKEDVLASLAFIETANGNIDPSDKLELIVDSSHFIGYAIDTYDVTEPIRISHTTEQVPALLMAAPELAQTPQWMAELEGQTPENIERLIKQLPKESSGNHIVQSHRYALLIGNRSYRTNSVIPNVRYAHNDLKVMASFLETSLGFPKENIFILKDLSKGQMETWLGSISGYPGRLQKDIVIPKQSELFVYYSGHGIPSDHTGRAMLLPVDSDLNATEVTGYPLEALYHNLNKLGLANTTVILESCFSGVAGNGQALMKGVSGLIRKRTRSHSNPLHRGTVITASQNDQFAIWNHQKQLGSFTHRLIKAVIEQPNRLNAFTGKASALSDLSYYLKTQVNRDARKLKQNAQQHPTMASSYLTNPVITKE